MAQVGLAVVGLSPLVDLVGADGVREHALSADRPDLVGAAETAYVLGRAWVLVLAVDVVWTVGRVLRR